MLSFELVEANPVIDEHNRTADLAVSDLLRIREKDTVGGSMFRPLFLKPDFHAD